jgi:cysteine desulfurase/selenocysteine lyase
MRRMELAARATDAYEGARETVVAFSMRHRPTRSFFSGERPRRSTLSLTAGAGRTSGKGDEIVITWLEHTPILCPGSSCATRWVPNWRVAPVDNDGQILLDEYQKLLGSRTKGGVALPGFERAWVP